MTPEKEQYYEKATRKLLKTIDSMGLNKIERLQAKNLTLLFRDSFKMPTVKYNTFRRDLGNNIGWLTYDSDGFCRVSSINFAIMMGGAPNWELRYINELWTYGPHHYLMHAPSKQIFDLTFDQYTNHGIEVPYDIGYKIPCELTKNDSAVDFANSIGIGAFIEQKNQKD